MNGKIINDPVYGFIRFPEPDLMSIIEHPWFQRLRNIKQMGMAQFVYPGAVHTRLHHSLGAAHLMGIALQEIRNKGVEVTNREYIAARQAILLHDIGHGPFSHALESTLIDEVSHEDISIQIMHRLNKEHDGFLDIAIQIFENKYEKPFLHQLVSSQLDVDRMDYLNRDSFFTGVSEGVIGYDRILQMLAVSEGDLVIEEKGIYSVEKFIVARRMMYWQVYLHKTVLGSEKLIIKILQRAKVLAAAGKDLFATPNLKFFLYNKVSKKDFEDNIEVLNRFCTLDDADISVAIKVWTDADDIILSRLCKMFVDRRLYKVKVSDLDLQDHYEALYKKGIASGFLNEENLDYYLFKGKTSNNAYQDNEQQIRLLQKNGTVCSLSNVEHALISSKVAMNIEKQFVCAIPELFKD